MVIFFVIGIDEDIIQIYNNKDTKFLGKDLVNIFLEV